MKIDLHIHTKKTLEDTFKRDIEPSEFIKKMKEASVGIAGITNHNIFNEDQFKKIVQLNNNDILILPGVELTVFVNEIKNIKHMNLIFDNDNESILKLQNFLKDKNISSKNPIDVYEVIDFFDDVEGKVIFYPDKKSASNERGFSDNEIKELFISNKNFKNVYVLDTNIKGYYHYFRNNVNSLIGSDVKDWNNYYEESKKLLNSITPIFSFEDLYRIFKNGDTFENFRRDNLVREINNIKLTNKNTLNKVPIVMNSINVIFGSKATGKSTLLRQLYETLDVENNKKTIYDEKTIKDDTDSLVKTSPNFEEFNKGFKSIKENITTAIQDILKHNEKLNENYINEFYMYHKNFERSKGKFNIIKTKTYEIEQNIKNVKIKKIVHYLKEIVKVNYENNETLWKSTLRIIKKQINDWKKEYLKINYEYFECKFIHKTISELKSILKINKNILAEVTEFGLYKIFKKRLLLNDKIKNFKNIIFNSSNNEKFNFKPKINLYEFEFSQEYIVPIENSKDLLTWIIVGSGYLNIKKQGSDKNHTLKELLEYLLKKEYKDFSNPKDKINNENKEIIFKSLNHENLNIFKEEFKFVLKHDKTKNKDPSAGEKSYIFLKNILSKKDVDWFFLDEPEEHLNSQFISEFLLLDIDRLIKERKTIIITTHNNVLGLNTMPSNYILRENIETSNGTFNTWYGNMVDKNMVPLFDNEKNRKIDIQDVILKYFEGNKQLYIYRSNIYNVKKDKNEK